MAVRILMGAPLVLVTVAPITAQEIPSGIAAHTLLGRVELMLTALLGAVFLVLCAFVIAAIAVVVWRVVSRTVMDVTRFMTKIH